MVYPTFIEENRLWKQGYLNVVGIDEVGRGAFAGPLVVGAVIFDKFAPPIVGINDSKLVSPKKRELLTPQIKKAAKAWAVAEVSVSVINKVGIGKASQIAFRKVIKLLSIQPDFVLIDAFYIRHFKRKKQKAIIKGDQKCVSIAAASIIAKVYRDNLMRKLHDEFPVYDFARHKGYGTKLHQNSIREYGLCKLHRTSFHIQA